MGRVNRRLSVPLEQSVGFDIEAVESLCRQVRKAVPEGEPLPLLRIASGLFSTPASLYADVPIEEEPEQRAPRNALELLDGVRTDG